MFNTFCALFLHLSKTDAVSNDFQKLLSFKSIRISVAHLFNDSTGINILVGLWT